MSDQREGNVVWKTTRAIIGLRDVCANDLFVDVDEIAAWNGDGSGGTYLIVKSGAKFHIQGVPSKHLERAQEALKRAAGGAA